MKFDDKPFLALVDEANGLACYHLPVDDHTNRYAQWLRSLFIDIAHSRGYAGYDTNYDHAFHQRSSYFYIKRWNSVHSDILMMVRVTDADDKLQFPFEAGKVVNGNGYQLNNRVGMRDLNTFFSTSKPEPVYYNLLFASVCHYIRELGTERVFGLVDLDRKKLQTLYFNELKFSVSKQFNEPVFFPGYTYSKRLSELKKDVEWLVIEWKRNQIEYFAEKAVSYLKFEL